MMNHQLTEVNKKATKEAVENHLAEYRLFKHHSFEEREVNITASYEERLHGPTYETGDQTANAAIANVDGKEYRRKLCERVEKSIKRLPPLERHLVEERYLAVDADYITDIQVYSFKFQPPISRNTYYKIQWRAFHKMAFHLDLLVTE